MQREQEIDKELEPFYGLHVAAELCGCTFRAFDSFLYKHARDFPAHYHHDGDGPQRRRVLFRSEVIEIRRRMLNGLVNIRDRANGTGNVRLNKPKRGHFDKPSAFFLLNNG